jgi:hypothetical protein
MSVVNIEVRALMKDDLYNKTTCFTRESLAVCSCTCKSGLIGKNKIVCMYTLSCLMSLVYLLLGGLAEHVL